MDHEYSFWIPTKFDMMKGRRKWNKLTNPEMGDEETRLHMIGATGLVYDDEFTTGLLVLMARWAPSLASIKFTAGL